MAYEHPKHPYRPVLFDGDYPPPTETYAQVVEAKTQQFEAEMAEQHISANFEFARQEREELLRRRQSGSLAQPYYLQPNGPLSPRETKRETEYEQKARELQYGLPDSAEDMPAVAVKGGLPVRFR